MEIGFLIKIVLGVFYLVMIPKSHSIIKSVPRGEVRHPNLFNTICSLLWLPTLIVILIIGLLEWLAGLLR